ncbi:hypothetical protein Q73_07060 [Bacillus coahuilensis m2-6]|uniref:Metallo-beta-lactamase domain-containing protein n=2 Tax=Bacillus coahuilensis TaxID=408580 RepID=A0A147K8D7_9BACI|nr:MBL fold metallo-hydrolase [Bacillus coahuilensis]KUP06397.1 hypothetical protein Q75_07590 [Bacillus coahuilensis p1.1.43]KUP08266.1 hypothetical protein Q73_07060 [Bacillus coahuilensis m2-6]
MKDRVLPFTSIENGVIHKLSDDVFSITTKIVNVIVIVKDSTFVLVDTGFPDTYDLLVSKINDITKGKELESIILTHGHFDHVGNIDKFLSTKPSKVYAHNDEFPYLDGTKDYPKPDGSVEGGLVAKISPTFPNEGINIKEYLYSLEKDGTVPTLPEWKWFATPGHTSGHISLYREKDGLLIAGDAFVTVRQDSLYKVFVQDTEVNGPPRYFTEDWAKAEQSVILLESLKPKKVITGHGNPMESEALSKELAYLAHHFKEIAKPDYGKFV